MTDVFVFANTEPILNIVVAQAAPPLPEWGVPKKSMP